MSWRKETQPEKRERVQEMRRKQSTEKEHKKGEATGEKRRYWRGKELKRKRS